MIRKFRSATSDKSESSRLNYAKAIKCLETFAGTYTYSSDFPSEQTLADWFLNMRVRGISRKTAIHYLDIISALYKETSSSSNPDNLRVFGQFKVRVKQIIGMSKNEPIDENVFNKALSISKSAPSHYGAQQCAVDILLYSLLNRAMPLADVAKVKVSDIEPDNDVISVIIKRNTASNRKYLFNLDQSKLTLKQLVENVERKVRGLFIANNIPILQSIENTIKLIWTYTALKCGIPGSEILSLLSSPPDGIGELSLCVEAKITEQRQKALTETVNMLLTDNPLRWYAMKLRTRIEFEDVVERIKNLDEHILHPDFFYPYEEICKRVHKKIVKEKHPVIRDIVFFRLRVTDIFPLFCKIGDLAWCYTTTGQPGGDYAPIPKRSFELFQETIGHFTPEYEIAPIGGFEPREGESVVIINGPLATYEFEVDKAKDASNIIFQLNMIGDNGFQWRTSAKKRQLEPVVTK